MRLVDKEELVAKARVEQWLRACETDGLASSSSSSSAVNDLLNNEALVAALNAVLLGQNAATTNADLVSKLCGVLFYMYRADEPGFKECVFQLLPAIVCCYLNCLAVGGGNPILAGAAAKRGPCQRLEE
jgi:hypothetical protein